MFRAKMNQFVVLSLALSLTACATGGRNSDLAPYYESAYNDHNRAPASMAPAAPAKSDAVLDEVHMRTQADYYFAMGEAQSYAGDTTKAIESFKMVSVYDTKSAQIHVRLAGEYVKAGMLSEALEQVDLATKKNPKFVDAYLLMGGLHSTLKLYSRAIESYQKVLAIEPKNTEAPMYLGAVYAEQKKYDQAIKCFEGLVKNDDYETPHLAYYYIGRLKYEQKGAAGFKEAETAFKKSIEARPGYVEAVLALGELYEKSHKEKMALSLYKDYQNDHGPSERIAEVLAQKYLENEEYDLAYEQLQLLEQNSDDPISVKLRMALILIEKKKYQTAVEKLHEVLRQVPDSDKIRFYLAAVYEEMNKPAEAITHFTKIPAQSPFYGESVVHAAYLLKTQGELDKAISIVKDGLKQKDDVPQFYSLYASLLDEKGDYKEAISLLENGVKKFPDQVQIRFFLGTVYDRVGNKEQVVANMKHVIELDPNHVQGLNYLAYTYADSEKNLEEAETLVKRALQIEPNDGFIMDTFGWVLLKKGETKQAIKILEAAHRAQPKESVIAEHLGDAYYEFQLTDKARDMYMRAIETESDNLKVKEIKAKISAIENQVLPKQQPRTPASVREAHSGQ